MNEKRKEDEARELTPEEIDDLIFEEQIASGEHNEKVPEYYFSNPDPYAKVEHLQIPAQNLLDAEQLLHLPFMLILCAKLARK